MLRNLIVDIFKRMLEGIIAFWMHEGIIEIKHDYMELQNLVPLPITNLWDLYRLDYLRDDVLPYIRGDIRRARKELHCLLCTSKTAYINGYPKIENNISRIRQAGG